MWSISSDCVYIYEKVVTGRVTMKQSVKQCININSGGEPIEAVETAREIYSQV